MFSDMVKFYTHRERPSFAAQLVGCFHHKTFAREKIYNVFENGYFLFFYFFFGLCVFLAIAKEGGKTQKKNISI